MSRKKRIITIIGVRPEFIRIEKFSRELSKFFDHTVIHTGQHYDYLMSKVFFQELKIAEPDYYLGISNTPNAINARVAGRIAQIITGLEKVFMKLKPDAIIVHGDSDSTLAGAIAAAKSKIPLIHIEAGMRSFDNTMPEEINRKITDHLTSTFFCSSKVSHKNLEHENIKGNTYISGDLMLDVFKDAKNSKSAIFKDYLSKDNYYYMTIHRAENTNDPKRFKSIFSAISSLDLPVIFPIHPRTKKLLTKLKLTSKKINVIEPVTYLEGIALMQHAKSILTDSGGIQKEAYWLKIPCFTIRNTTEWTETVDAGWNQLVLDKIDNLANLVKNLKVPKNHASLYGEGTAGIFIAKKLNEILNDS